MIVHASEEIAAIDHIKFGPTKLAMIRALDQSPEQVTHQLHAVANAQDGNAESEDRGIACWRSRLEDARGAARKNDSLGCDPPDFVDADARTYQQAEDSGLAHAARDKLGSLAAKVENEDRFGAGRWKLDHGEGGECSTPPTTLPALPALQRVSDPPRK